MRLIDADALMQLLQAESEELEQEFPTDKSVKAFLCGVRMACDYVRAAPTVDAVTVLFVANLFGQPPCGYAFDDVNGFEVVDKVCGDWCDTHCNRVSLEDCWMHFLKAMLERKANEL
ncbi:hypothetical protein [Anaerotignum sp.]